jgi:hypothetical protein
MRISIVFALCAALAACSTRHSTRVDASDARNLLIDRNWLDRMPQSPREKLHVYRFVPTMGGGVYQDRTLYKGTFELFRFTTDARQIDFELPETHQHVTSAYRIERVDGPQPFDLRLTVDNDPRGPHVYYGMRAEQDVSGAALEARLAGAVVQPE